MCSCYSSHFTALMMSTRWNETQKKMKAAQNNKKGKTLCAHSFPFLQKKTFKYWKAAKYRAVVIVASFKSSKRRKEKGRKGKYDFKTD